MITLPLPPSVNHYYSQNRAGRRYKTSQARDWEHEAGWVLKKSKCKKFGKREVMVKYLFYMPDNRSDYINRAKILDDLFEKMGIIDNDRQIVEAYIYKNIDHDSPRVEIEIKAIEDKFKDLK